MNDDEPSIEMPSMPYQIKHYVAEHNRGREVGSAWHFSVLHVRGVNLLRFLNTMGQWSFARNVEKGMMVAILELEWKTGFLYRED